MQNVSSAAVDIARQQLRQFAHNHALQLQRAYESGQPVGWVSTKFPPEIAAALGLVTCCPESMAAAEAANGRSAALCERAEQLGYCEDLCSYSRIGLSLAEEALRWGKRPSFLLCCDNICVNMIPWYENLARRLEIPLFLLDVPYLADESGEEERLTYLRGQFHALTRQLSDFCGAPWDEARFEEACRSSNRTSRSWNRLCNLLVSRQCPFDGIELFDYMPLLVNCRCDPATAGLLDALTEAFLHAPAPQPPRWRLMLEGTPCWCALNEILAPLRRQGIGIVADTITPSLGLEYSGLDGLLRACCRTINGSTLKAGLETRKALCRSRSVDGILIHSNRSCRPWSGILPELESCLSQEGWAVVTFEGDQADPRALQLSQYLTRVEGFGEILEQRAGSSSLL